MTSRAHLDVDLVRRYLAGDVAAFNELMAAHEDRVFGVCLRMLRNREAALDATQETFLTVFRKADRFSGQSAFSTWIYRVAVNTCYDQLRRSKRHKASSLPEDHDPADPTSADPLTSVELRPDIETALMDVQTEYRAALVLVDLEGLALEAAADILGIPIGTVKSRLFRGRRHLAAALGNLKPSSDPHRGEHHA